jgi:hypothetical protein
MSLKLDSDGNIVVDDNGVLIQVTGQSLLEQNAKSELRCEQQQYFADDEYGRNILVWKVATGQADRIADIKRIVTKYYQPTSISASNDGLYVIT